MSTRSTVAVVLSNGEVRSTYVHWDGAVEHNGRLLIEYWDSQELAEQLTSFGSISVIGKTAMPVGSHSFKNPEKDVCIFYHRDRGDPKNETNPKIYSSVKEYLMKGNFQDYNYLFGGGEWIVFKEVKINTDGGLIWHPVKMLLRGEINHDY
jgi:hypothetical protein